MLLSTISAIFAFANSCRASLLPATEQTSFSYPSDGWGSPIAFPNYLAKLTGLSDWPTPWAVPPFTPNMAVSYYANINATVPRDIIFAPHPAGASSSFSCVICRMLPNIRWWAYWGEFQTPWLSLIRRSEDNVFPNWFTDCRRLSPHPTPICGRSWDRYPYMVASRPNYPNEWRNLRRTSVDDLYHSCSYRPNTKTLSSPFRSFWWSNTCRGSNPRNHSIIPISEKKS